MRVEFTKASKDKYDVLLEGLAKAGKELKAATARFDKAYADVLAHIESRHNG